MIEINNLAFSYGPKTVLKNISMKVSEGNIYGPVFRIFSVL